jgi:hypothetical protein
VLYRKTNDDHCKNHMEHVNTLWGKTQFRGVKTGKYSCQSNFKDYNRPIKRK